MRRDGQQDPERARLRSRSAPIPPAAMISEEGAAVKTSLRRQPRGLDSRPLLAKNQHIPGMGEWELLGLGPLSNPALSGLPLVGSETVEVHQHLKSISVFP